MSEAARQAQRSDGPDVVRRMLVRPIRAEPAYQAEPDALSDDAAAVDAWEADRDADEAASDPGLDPVEDDADPVIARMRSELTLMKAVLKAERSESAALRAMMEPDLDESPEARATRERWSRLVDGLLRQAL